MKMKMFWEQKKENEMMRVVKFDDVRFWVWLRVGVAWFDVENCWILLRIAGLMRVGVGWFVMAAVNVMIVGFVWDDSILGFWVLFLIIF